MIKSNIRGQNEENVKDINLYGFGEPLLNPYLIDSGVDLIRISVEALNEADYEKLCGVKIDLSRYVSMIKDLYLKSRESNTKIAIKIINSMIQNEKDEQLFLIHM